MFKTDIEILLIDDLEVMRTVVSKRLSLMGYTNITEVANASDAWLLINNMDYGLIITDWNLPDMSGLELLKRVKGSSRFSHIPVMMITVEATKEYAVKAVQAGADSYIVKPFDSDTLSAKLEAMYARVTDGEEKKQNNLKLIDEVDFTKLDSKVIEKVAEIIAVNAP